MACIEGLMLRYLVPILYIGFITLFVSCESRTGEQPDSLPPEKVVSIEKENFTFPVVIDTSSFKSAQFKNSEPLADWQRAAQYHLLYIGKWQDTIYPDHGIMSYPIPPPSNFPPGSGLEPSDTIGWQDRLEKDKMFPYYRDWKSRVHYKSCRNSELSIKVDTRQKVKKFYYIFNYEELWAEPFFEAYPVIIENKENDTIEIASGNHVPMITEAKDSTGNWRPIEERYTHPSGVGVGAVILPPKEIGLSAAMIYHGNFSTTLRLRIGSTFSNEFNGHINYWQFEGLSSD